jgi:serine/threonine protein kinase
MSSSGDADDRSNDDEDPDLVEWAAEMADRIQSGEPVDLDELERTRPELAAMLRRLLSAIKMMSSLKERPASEAGEGPEQPRRVDEGLKQLGDFELVREIGRGGMGVVYEARQCKLGRRRVALKILPEAAALDPRLVRRFQVEVQAAACLDHPHIVPVYEVGQAQGVAYYAMRFIEGRSLATIVQELRRLKRLRDRAAPAEEEKEDPSKPDAMATTIANVLSPGPPAGPATTQAEGRSPAGEPPGDARSDPAPEPTSYAAPGSSTGDRAYFRTAARLIIEAAEALDYAHQEGVIHRDVKPANLLVDLQGRLWIVDFGVARLRGGAGLTRQGELVGTIRYMSPEQAKGGPIPIDRLTDVYSLGATLYEMLTLRPAFSGRDPVKLLRRVVDEEPRPPRRLNRRISRDLENIVLKAMAKDRTQRYRSAGELAEDLGRFLKGLPVRARRAPIWRRAVAWVKTHRTTAAVVSAALAAAFLFVWVRGVLQAKEEVYLVRRFESASVGQAAELIPLLRVSRPSVVAWLDQLYRTGDPDRKLAAALALAPTRQDC